MDDTYDIAIVGGGASGTALLYTLARYCPRARVVLLEKHFELGSVNSNAVNNSQTLHVGDIETNYTLEKVREVLPAAMMVACYGNAQPPDIRERFLFPMQKMVLAVGEKEVAELEARYDALRPLFPTLTKLYREDISQYEPLLVTGRSVREPILALMNPHGYAVNYGELAKRFVEDAHTWGNERVRVYTNTKVTALKKDGTGYALTTSERTIFARAVVVDADAYSLSFAKALGYGMEFSLIPIAGSFFFADVPLRGKVYRVQDPRMPFAAVHGDPDLTKKNMTRFGPTARFFPVLESRNLKTMLDFFRVSGLTRGATWISFVFILLEPVRAWYLLRNLLYDIPIVGVWLLLPELQKIVPTLRSRDLSRAYGYGGMRLQRVNTTTHELLLGEGKIVGENIIFNMTPSPGASVCLYNAMRDAERLATMLPDLHFQKTDMARDLCLSLEPLTGNDPSLPHNYAS